VPCFFGSTLGGGNVLWSEFDDEQIIASNESVIITSIMSAAGLLTADDMASDSSHPVLELGFRATLPTLPAEGLPSR